MARPNVRRNRARDRRYRATDQVRGRAAMNATRHVACRSTRLRATGQKHRDISRKSMLQFAAPRSRLPVTGSAPRTTYWHCAGP